ncbi:hypothetical protein [Mycoplasmoides alvi]|uniref:hypothetical protein n=1 Tax=Mycoplasmoides alvi TaxID=78580 RepID=UPI00051B1333|nr:hypothetical protein [Mycoplasmoides alvi]
MKNKGFWNCLKLPYEDWYFSAFLISNNFKALVTNEIFYCYRVNNLNSNVTSSSRLSLKKRLQIFNEWFTSSKIFNIYTSHVAKEYFNWIIIYNAIPTIGFRKTINLAKNINETSPSLKDIKNFIKKYKVFNGIKKIYIYLMLNNFLLDFLLGRFCNKFIAKHKINVKD